MKCVAIWLVKGDSTSEIETMRISQDGSVSTRIEPGDTRSLSTIFAENPSYQALEGQYVGSQSLNDKIHVQICDVTNMAADAVVCSTRTDMSLEPVGICKRVWEVGGPKMKNACLDIGHCEPGHAFLTLGYELPAKYVLFTAGPPSDTTLTYTERKQCLRESYRSCLQLVSELSQVRSVAIPCLGAGGAGIDLSSAISIAVDAIREWLTTGDNSTQVDRIILCMYDEYQWSKYCPMLIKTFPCQREVPSPRLSSVSADQGENGPSTNILCYKYKKDKTVTEAIDQHFSQLVETLRQTLSCPKTQVTSHGNVVTLELKTIGHFLHAHHTMDRAMLEFQIVKVMAGTEAVDVTSCSQTQAVIEDFLAAHFDNLTTFTVYVRCCRSTMGEIRGLVRMDKLLDISHSDRKELSCQHPLTRFKHKITKDELLKYWKFSKMVNNHGDGSIFNSHHHHQHQHHQRAVEEYPASDSTDISHTPPYSSGVVGVSSRQNIVATCQPSPRDVDQDSWVSSRESSSLSENTTESSDSNVKETVSQATGCAKNRQAENRTPILSNISGVFRRGMQKLRAIGSESSSSSSGNDTESRETQTPTHRRSSTPGQLTQYQVTAGTCAMKGGSAMARDRTRSQTESESSGSDVSLSWHMESSAGVTVSMETLKPAGACSRCNSQSDDTHSLSASKQLPTSTDVRGVEFYNHFKGNDTKGSLSSSQDNSLCDKTLLNIARHIGNKQKELGIELNLLEYEVQSCQQKAEGNLNMFGLHILRKWRSKGGNECNLEALLSAMDNCDIDTYHLRNNV